MSVLKGLEPLKVFKFFEYISSVPRGSGNTGKVADLCVKFAKERKLTCYRDSLNNVVIYKEASNGYEDAPTVVLQGHLDMVCEKENGVDIDMAVTPIELAHDGKYVFAKGTTLGGDDGIAVAYALAILDSDEIKHPALEAVFTIDEETGMDGARGLDGSVVTGRLLLNIDSEEEGVFTCGCAGGCRVDCRIPVNRVKLSTGYKAYKVSLNGLAGGHSGTEINSQPASSNHILGRVLFELHEKYDIRLISFEGGKFDNVIASATEAVIAVKDDDITEVKAFLKDYESELKLEYGSINPLMKLEISENGENVDDISALDTESADKVLSAVYFTFQGVIEMDAELKDMVQTSQNMGVTCLKENEFMMGFLVRSSIDRQKETAVNRISALVKMLGGSVELFGNYPGWKYAADSKLRDLCVKNYKKIFGKEPVVNSIHAGLECGILADKLKGLDVVSMGPDIHDIHTPKERLDIASVERTWKLILGILEDCINL